MSENSSIEWTDATFNPWIGCTKVSPGCANCYAEKSTRARVLRAAGQETWGKGAERSKTKTWGDPVKWNREDPGSFQEVVMRDGTIHRGTIEEIAALELLTDDIKMANPARRRVFCASLADWLDEEVPIAWLAELLELIKNTPNLDWLLLTKRPQNWRDRLGLAARHTRESGGDMSLYCAWGHGQPPGNVWIGTTVEDQTRADERVPMLLSIPAAVRFLSCEPLLGPVDLGRIDDDDNNTLDALTGDWAVDGRGHQGPSERRIHWVIAGGESGPKARPMHPKWARGLRDQCLAAGVPFLFKQWGEWRHADSPQHGLEIFKVGTPATMQLPGDPLVFFKVGKKAAGRTLDGRKWTEFPTGKEGA